MGVSSETAPRAVLPDDIICYCFSITYEEAERLFAQKNIVRFDQVPVKTKMCSAQGCRACELNLKEHFFPEELGGDGTPSEHARAKSARRDVRSLLSDAKAALYRWIDSRVPVKRVPIRVGLPVLISNRIRTYYRIMNLPYPEGNLPIAEQDLHFAFYDAGGRFQSAHRITLGCGRIETFDVAEISRFDPSSPALQVGFCRLTLIPKAISCFGTLRGYIEFKTPRHAATVHEHDFRLRSIRFFVFRSKLPKGRYYMRLHNTAGKLAKVNVALNDRAGNVLARGGVELSPLATGFYTLEDFFPELPAADASRGCLIRVTSTQPLAPTFLFWDPDSGLITAQHLH